MRKDVEPVTTSIRILVAWCALLSSLFLCCRAQLQASPSAGEEILDYHSDIRVQQDASLLVRETIRVRSAAVKIQHGIYRDFPTAIRISHMFCALENVLDSFFSTRPDR